MANDPIFIATPILKMVQISQPAINREPIVPYLWGSSSAGIIGDNQTTSNRSSPVSIIGAHLFASIAISGTAVAIKQDGTAWGWGDNSLGAIGDSSTTDRSSPVSVVGAHSFSQIGTGNTSYALKSNNGTVWAWGLGSSGRLGDNTTASKSSPTSIVGAHSFIQVAAGVIGLALKSDGSIWAWGAATNGQLGDNQTSANRSSPTSVIGAHSFTAVSVGSNSHSLALKADGSLWAWGAATNGILGDNQTSANRSSPTSVIGAHSFIQISAGNAHSLALKQDGSVWTWGLASSGQIGDNTVTSRSSPTSVVGDHSFIQIGAGGASSIALKADGTAWTWGGNGSGQLADGTATARSSPVLVVGEFKYKKLPSNSNNFGALSYGPLAVIKTGAAEGTRIDSIVIQAAQSISAGMVRLWLSDANGVKLFKEITVLPLLSNATMTFSTTIQLNFNLAAGTSLLASTNNNEIFNVFTIGGDY